ncbi:MAG: MlaD family protein [Paludibacteraceae bacterium]|nr:MlaD family protein [Paludibacteraceae bacterium]
MEQKKKFWNRETKIGLAVACAIAMLYFGINFLKGINIFTPNSVFYVQYDRVDGIVKTSHVLINGYQVGHVSDIRFDYTKEAPITLELTVDKQLVVPKGTIAEVYETGLLGDKAIQLRLGRSNEICQYGDTLEGTITGGMLANIAGELVPPIKEMIPTVDSTIRAIKNVIEGEKVNNILTNTEGATKNLKIASAKLNTVLDKDVPPIMADAKRITSNLDKITTDVSKADLKRTLDEVNTTINNLKLVTNKFNSTDNTIGLLLNDKQLYYHIDSIAFNANALVVDLKENPKRYVHFSLFGAKDKKPKETKK